MCTCTQSHDRFSLLRKNLHVYLLYISVDILARTCTWYANFSNIHACLSVCSFFFFHYEVASELISFQLLLVFTFTYSASYVFIDVTYTFIQPI